jgi:hypothetical protein
MHNSGRYGKNRVARGFLHEAAPRGVQMMSLSRPSYSERLAKQGRPFMNVIDCDAHVEESVETWSYLDPEFYLLRPLPVLFPEDTCFGSHNAAWVIDYKLRFFASNPTIMARAKQKDVPIPVQELRDVKQRLACMDEMGIDKQVIFPSIWLGCLA